MSAKKGGELSNGMGKLVMNAASARAGDRVRNNQTHEWATVLHGCQDGRLKVTVHSDKWGDYTTKWERTSVTLHR